MVSKSEFIFSDPRSFRSRRENDLCLNSDIVKLKNQWVEKKTYFFFILECFSYRWERWRGGSFLVLFKRGG